MSIPFSLRAELKGVEVAPGVTLRYWEAGAGRVLVMLPGLGHAASMYKYQLEGLCDEFRVIALDPRGHGESDWPAPGFTDTEIRCHDGTGGVAWSADDIPESLRLRR